MSVEYKHRLLKRIDFLKSLIVPFFQSYHTITKEQYNSNIRLRREIEKWVEDAINCVIDISKTPHSEKKMVIPETNRELLENIDLPRYTQNAPPSCLCACLRPAGRQVSTCRQVRVGMNPVRSNSNGCRDTPPPVETSNGVNLIQGRGVTGFTWII